MNKTLSDLPVHFDQVIVFPQRLEIFCARENTDLDGEGAIYRIKFSPDAEPTAIDEVIWYTPARIERMSGIQGHAYQNVLREELPSLVFKIPQRDTAVARLISWHKLVALKPGVSQEP